MGLIPSNGLIALAGALIALRKAMRMFQDWSNRSWSGKSYHWRGTLQSLTLAERLITIVVELRLSVLDLGCHCSRSSNTNYLRPYSAQ